MKVLFRPHWKIDSNLLSGFREKERTIDDIKEIPGRLHSEGQFQVELLDAICQVAVVANLQVVMK